MTRRSFTLNGDRYRDMIAANNPREQRDAVEALRCFWAELGREWGFDPATVTLGSCEHEYTFEATLTRRTGSTAP